MHGAGTKLRVIKTVFLVFFLKATLDLFSYILITSPSIWNKFSFLYFISSVCLICLSIDASSFDWCREALPFTAVLQSQRHHQSSLLPPHYRTQKENEARTICLLDILSSPLQEWPISLHHYTSYTFLWSETLPAVCSTALAACRSACLLCAGLKHEPESYCQLLFAIVLLLRL